MNENIANTIDKRKGKVVNVFFDLFLSPAQQRRGYAEYPNMADYETIFQVLIEVAPIEKGKKEKYDSLLKETSTNCSQELFSSKPLKGLKLLEIGGYFSMNLEKLGAISEKRDAAIDDNEYITLQNYKKTLQDNQYDITFSKEVFDKYSDIENGKEFSIACQELLTVFSNLTRNGGISMHEGRMDEALTAKFLKKIGLRLESIFLHEWCDPPFKIYVFKKYL